jgi:uncharacterized protein YcfL
MQTYCLMIALAVSLTSCASSSNTDVEQAVLADAKQRAIGLCSERQVECKYRLSKIKEGWTVRVDPILMKDGSHSRVVDGDDMYFYDMQGRFTDALRGY